MTLDEQRRRLLHDVRAAVGILADNLNEIRRIEEEMRLVKPKLEPGVVRIAETSEEARVLSFALNHYIEHAKESSNRNPIHSDEWKRVYGLATTINERLRSLGDWDRTTDVRVSKDA